MEYAAPDSTVYPALEQIIALGRGVELNSDEFPGTVQQGSPRSGDSYARAFMSGWYAFLHPEVNTVAFSGGVSVLVPEHEQPSYGSEGEGMETVGRMCYSQIPAKVEPRARTTVGNFVESVKVGILDPNKATGIVVDERQRQNAVWAARLVMPHADIRVISPYDNPGIKATPPDQKLSNDPNMRPTRNDRISGALYRVAMIGVTPGDVEKIDARDQMIQRNVIRLLHGVRAIRGALGSVRHEYQGAI